MLVYVVGTKAQYIKMAPVIAETLRRQIRCSLVFTGQHRETFDELQRNFSLPGPDHVLVPGEEVKTRLSFLSWGLRAWRRAGARELRDEVWSQARAVVVHGDTASTLLGALIAKRFSVPLAHVEAGLRSFDFLHPFPEEAIRVLVSRLTALHLCPDRVSLENLAGAPGEKVLTHGNTMVDALRVALSSMANPASPGEDDYAVFSMHRQENLFKKRRLTQALDVLRQLAGDVVPMKFVLHPVTRKRLDKLGLLTEIARWPGVRLVDRMDFVSFSRLIRGARFVVTDGGSNQEECAALGIPCALLRRATERGDGLEERGVLLADLDGAQIANFAREAVSHRFVERPLTESSPSSEVVDALCRMAALETSRCI
ncbi:UDP-N-acetylglucosamine 2-epimerase (non-hydrolyzing) [Lysobacter enzymogenes]|uniref:UDP-N-acetyl glucosamine 2-epimerase n=1 Tax=Lysobacter enzymogenes TaxID=69 RepID=UPI003394C545